MKNVTLGGERLGAGKKQKVELRNYERSTHDIGYLWRSTMSAGTLVPFICEVGLPGDTFDINLQCDIKTHPTVGPLFGSYKVQLDVFEAPVRLYQGQLHNNKLGIGMKMSNVLLPQLRLTANRYTATDLLTPGFDLDNSQINPSCVLAYLGIRGVGWVQTTLPEVTYERLFNGIPLLAYWDIYKNYYSNKQEEIGAVIHTPTEALITTVTTAEIQTPPGSAGEAYPMYPPDTDTNIPLTSSTLVVFNYTGTAPKANQIMMLIPIEGEMKAVAIQEALQNIQTTATTLQGQWNFTKYGDSITRTWRYITSQELNTKPPEVATFPLANIDTMREQIFIAVNEGAFIVNDHGLTPYDWVTNQIAGRNPMLGSQEGLGLKTYQSDLFNNWLQTEWIDGVGGISEVTAIDTSGGSFTIDTLNLSKKVYDMLNRIAVSGGTYDDWQDSVYMHDRIVRAESPIYHGGLIKELIFQEVVSNSEAEGDSGNQPLGTLAGRGTLAQKHKGGQITIRVNEIGYIIGIVSLTPRIDYSQGNKWDTHLATMDDFHKPQLDEIGFQELITEQMAWWSTIQVSDPFTTWTTMSAGKQPAWINYMTNINRVLGNFAIKDNEMFMTLNRRYEPDITTEDVTGILDLTTYIDPIKFNHIFAQTSIDAQNFWAQIAVDMTVRRKMSAKVMPNL